MLAFLRSEKCCIKNCSIVKSFNKVLIITFMRLLATFLMYVCPFAGQASKQRVIPLRPPGRWDARKQSPVDARGAPKYSQVHPSTRSYSHVDPRTPNYIQVQRSTAKYTQAQPSKNKNSQASNHGCPRTRVLRPLATQV